MTDATEERRLSSALMLARVMGSQNARLAVLLADPRPGFDSWNEDVSALLLQLDATYRRMLYLKLSVVPGRHPPLYEMQP